MFKKIYFTGTDYEELKNAFNLICTIKKLYITKNEPVYFGYKVVKKNGYTYLCLQYAFQNYEFGNGYSLIPMSLKPETLCRLLFDFVNDKTNYPDNYINCNLGYNIVCDDKNKIDDNEAFHIFIDKL